MLLDTIEAGWTRSWWASEVATAKQGPPPRPSRTRVGFLPSPFLLHDRASCSRTAPASIQSSRVDPAPPTLFVRRASASSSELCFCRVRDHSLRYHRLQQNPSRITPRQSRIATLQKRTCLPPLLFSVTDLQAASSALPFSPSSSLHNAVRFYPYPAGRLAFPCPPEPHPSSSSPSYPAPPSRSPSPPSPNPLQPEDDRTRTVPPFPTVPPPIKAPAASPRRFPLLLATPGI